MQAHVICMNDFPDCVIIGSEGYAYDFMIDRQISYYHQHKNQFRASFEDESDWECYLRGIHWHVRTVNCIQENRT